MCIRDSTTTERPITLSHGTNQLVGTDASAIVAAFDRVMAGEVEGRRPELWDGATAGRTIDAMEAYRR